MFHARAVRILLAAAAAWLAVWALPATAHHGWSGYSETAERFTGVIRSVVYGNPHVTVALETKERTWRVVLAPPSRMEGRGLEKGTLAGGVTATIEAYRHQREQGELRAEWIEVGEKRTELR